jgi:hypothetical protein
VNEDGVFVSQNPERERKRRGKTMLAERRSFKPDDRVEAMSEACYNKRRNTLENPTSRIPTHTTAGKTKETKGCHDKGKRKKRRPPTEMFQTSWSTTIILGRRGGKRGEKEEVKVFWR